MFKTLPVSRDHPCRKVWSLKQDQDEKYRKRLLQRPIVRMTSLRHYGGNLAKQGMIHPGCKIIPKLTPGSFLGITADEDYGGLAMGYQAHCIVMEEVSRASGGI